MISLYVSHKGKFRNARVSDESVELYTYLSKNTINFSYCAIPSFRYISPFFLTCALRQREEALYLPCVCNLRQDLQCLFEDNACCNFVTFDQIVNFNMAFANTMLNVNTVLKGLDTNENRMNHKM